jgi:hypothetical protein
VLLVKTGTKKKVRHTLGFARLTCIRCTRDAMFIKIPPVWILLRSGELLLSSESRS